MLKQLFPSRCFLAPAVSQVKQLPAEAPLQVKQSEWQSVQTSPPPAKRPVGQAVKQVETSRYFLAVPPSQERQLEIAAPLQVKQSPWQSAQISVVGVANLLDGHEVRQLVPSRCLFDPPVSQVRQFVAKAPVHVRQVPSQLVQISVVGTEN